MTLLRSAQSLEYLRITVNIVDTDGNTVDPTSNVVSFAFLSEGVAPDADTAFVDGDWETDNADPSNPIYFARLLVGPDPGLYIPTAGTRVDVWLRIGDDPEVPKLHSGSVRFL